VRMFEGVGCAAAGTAIFTYIAEVFPRRTGIIMVRGSYILSQKASLSRNTQFIQLFPDGLTNKCSRFYEIGIRVVSKNILRQDIPQDHLLLDKSPNFGLLISRWELDKFKNS
jgi:hypothetical protein